MRTYVFIAKGIVGVLGLCLCLVFSCTHPVRRLVFQPHHISSIPAFPDNTLNFNRLWIQSEQGPVEGWLFRGKGANGTHHRGAAVLMAHGNRELIDYYRNRAEAYQRLGVTVLLGEYRGYGRSAGTPSRVRIASDFMVFYDYLTSQPMVDPQKVVLHGRSLGGAVISELSRHRTAAGIIVESTFTSIKAMAHGAPDFLLVDRYDTLDALLDYSGPILIIHGTRDNVVPVAHALEMKKRIPRAELRLYDFGHSDGPPDWNIYWQDIAAFLKQVVD
jgi:fermentation-respiration switch protein FrsA (DUF1100 family)